MLEVAAVPSHHKAVVLGCDLRGQSHQARRSLLGERTTDACKKPKKQETSIICRGDATGAFVGLWANLRTECDAGSRNPLATAGVFDGDSKQSVKDKFFMSMLQ